MTHFFVDEHETFFYTATLVDEAGAPVVLAAVSTLTLTYYAVASGTIINNRNAQNVLNANNVTLHATSGLLTWIGQVADTTCSATTPEGAYEHRRALFTWTWGLPARTGRHEVDLHVRNQAKVP
jgi:hypothetical protein